jgi:hypothetical protein
MSNYFYYQKPNYKSSDNTKTITVDTDNNKIIIEDTTTGKIININTVGVQNQLSQGFSWVQLYEVINKTPAITFPPPNSTTLLINNVIDVINPTNTQQEVVIQPSKIIVKDNVSGTAIEILNDDTINASPYLRIQNITGQSNYLYFNELNADGHFNFKFNNNNGFFKQMNPFSFNQIELFDGDKIQKYYPFVFCQNVSSLKLYDYTEYLDDNGLAGWSFIISNYSGSDLLIATNGINWYAHSNGLTSDPIEIEKWVQCRITLVYSSIDNEFLYSVSQF